MMVTNVPKTHVAHTMAVSNKISLNVAQLLINATMHIAHLKKDVMKLITLTAVRMMINVIPMIVTHITVVLPPR